MWWSSASLLSGLIFLAFCGGDESLAEIKQLNERELAAELARLEESLQAEAESPDVVLDLARRARVIQGQADVLSPSTPSDLSRKGMILSVHLNHKALGVWSRKTTGPRIRTASDVDLVEGVTDSWNRMVNCILTYLRRWPEYWHAPLRIEGSEVYLPDLLISYCRTDQISGDNWEMPRISDPRQATLPESLVTCCLKAPDCQRLWSGADCRTGLIVEMAVGIERDAFLDYRFTGAFWDGVSSRGATDEALQRRIANGTMKLLTEVFGSAADLPKGDRPPGTPLSESEVLQWLRTSNSLWPPDGDPFQAIPGLRNPRIGSDGSITCDIIMHKACWDATPELARRAVKYYLGSDSKVLFK